MLGKRYLPNATGRGVNTRNRRMAMSVLCYKTGGLAGFNPDPLESG